MATTMKWKEKSRQREKEKSEGNKISIPEGNTCVRVLPDKKDIVKGKYVPTDNAPTREYRMHYGLGTDERRSVACGYDIDGKGKCWLCDVQLPTIQKTKPKMYARCQSKEAFLVQATIYDTDSETFGPPKPWSVSTGSGLPGRQGQSLAVRILSKINSSKKDYLSPTKGYNININRKGTQLNTRWEVEGDETPTVVDPEILKRMIDLDDVLPKYSKAAQRAAWLNEPAPSVGDDEEDEETTDEETTDEETTDEETTEENGDEENGDEENGDEENGDEENGEGGEEDSAAAEDDDDNPFSDDEEGAAEDEDGSADEDEEEPAPPKKKAAVKPAAKPAAKPAPPSKKKR